MSASGDGLTLENDQPTTVLSSVSSYLDGDGQIVTLLSTFIFGIGASLFVGVARIINAVVDFLTSPFTAAGEAIGKLFSGLLTSPVEILEDTAVSTATAISAQFGWLAFPVGVAVILASLWMINAYREQQETGDTIPGLPFDVPDIGPLQIGTTEENEDEQ